MKGVRDADVTLVPEGGAHSQATGNIIDDDEDRPRSLFGDLVEGSERWGGDGAYSLLGIKCRFLSPI